MCGRRGLATLLRSQRLGLGRGGPWHVFTAILGAPTAQPLSEAFVVGRCRDELGMLERYRVGGIPDGCFELGWSRLLGAVDATRRRRVPKALAGHTEFAF